MCVAISNSRDDNGEYYDVYGIEVNTKKGKEKVEMINKGIIPIKTNDRNLLDKFEDSYKRGNLKASVSPETYKDADIVIVDINLDVKNLENKPNINFDNFNSAILTLGQNVSQECLIIVETTVPPGTTEEIIYPTLLCELKKRFPSIKRINLAHSYERVMPGKNYLNSITNFWRVFSGIDDISAELCKSFLKTFIDYKNYPLSQLSNPRSSETAKILENSYRASNIAFINEWTIFAQEIGIDLYEILEAIKIRPTHNNIMKPGLGVGGYCLTKDPSMGEISAKQIYKKDSLKFPISLKALAINRSMPNNIINLIKNNSLDLKENLSILVLGLTYLADIDDIRSSPSIELIKRCESKNWIVDSHDPMISKNKKIKFQSKLNLPDPKDYDFIVLTVGHDYYKQLDWIKWLNGFNGILIDSNNILNNRILFKLKNLKIKILKVGRGDL